jgi:hypothetical protein
MTANMCSYVYSPDVRHTNLAIQHVLYKQPAWLKGVQQGPSIRERIPPTAHRLPSLVYIIQHCNDERRKSKRTRTTTTTTGASAGYCR